MAARLALHACTLFLQSRGTASKVAFIERSRGGEFDLRDSLTQARCEIPAAIRRERSLLSDWDAAPQKRMQDFVRKNERDLRAALLTIDDGDPRADEAGALLSVDGVF